jgi:hypothetical protein
MELVARAGKAAQAMKLRALRRLQREGEASPFVFVSELGSIRWRSIHRIDMPAGW